MSQPRRGSFIDHIASKLEPWITQNEPTPPQPPRGGSWGNAERTFSFQDGNGRIYDARWNNSQNAWEWKPAGSGSRWNRVTHGEDAQRMHQMFQQYQEGRPGGANSMGSETQRRELSTVLGGGAPDPQQAAAIAESEEIERKRQEELRQRARAMNQSMQGDRRAW